MNLVRSTIAEDFVHRMNNLVGTIPIWADLIRQELARPEPQKSSISIYLDEIKRDTGGLLRAAEQLKQGLQEEVVNVGFLLTSILRQINIQYQDDIELVSEIDSQLHEVLAIPSSLASALWNVVSNGVEAMSPGGGTLTVTATNFVDTSSSKWIRIEIQDTGSGILVENLNSIFAPHFTTKGEGRGYGLWRAKTVVEGLGGSITVQTQTRVGATFIILLPAEIEEEENG